MARMPDARWLGEHSPGTAMARYDIVCVHTIVGFAPAHAAHFSVHHDGTIDQSRDTKFRSGANLDGNHRVIAIENEDHGPAYGPWDTSNGHAVPAFTTAQIQANARILAWAHQTHGIPLQLCPDSRSVSRGLAYHRQGIDGNFTGYAYPGRIPGGEVWSKSTGKVCPGDRRISALADILALAKQLLTEEEDMATPQEIWDHDIPNRVTGTKSDADDILSGTHKDTWDTKKAVEALTEKVDQILARLPAPPA